MAFDQKPSTWLGAGYSLTANEIKLRTATAGSNVAIPEVTDAEANATTGDIRKVSFGLVEMLYQAWLTQAQADRPQRMNIVRNTFTDPATNLTTQVYQLTFVNQVTAQDVAAEPA